MSNNNAKEQVFAPTNSHWVAEVIELRKEVDDLRQRLDELQGTPRQINILNQIQYGIFSDAILKYTFFICCIIFGSFSLDSGGDLYFVWLWLLVPSLVLFVIFQFVRPFERFERTDYIGKRNVAFWTDISLGLISIGIFLFLLFIEPSFTSNLEHFSYLAIPTLVPTFTFIVLRPIHKLTVALTTSDHSIE